MIKYAFPIASAALLLLAGCDGTNDKAQKAPNATAQDVGIEKDVAGIEENVRLAAANKRIDQLQAEVEALKVNPQTIDMAMLKQRVEAVEEAVYARADDRGSGATSEAKNAAPSTTTDTPVAKPTAKPASTRKTQPMPARSATKIEADTFAKGGR